jgi:hypothetical protein
MKIHFIVGPYGSGRQKIFKKLLGTLKRLPGVTVVGDGIGGTAGKELIPDLDTTSLAHCLYQINQKIIQFDDCDHYVFSGTGLSIHIKSIMQAYPDAALYMVRRSDAGIELTPNILDTISSNFDVTPEWVTAHNAEVRAAHETYADELGVPWKPVNTPVFTINNTPNWAADNEVSDTSIEMAAYNL